MSPVCTCLGFADHGADRYGMDPNCPIHRKGLSKVSAAADHALAHAIANGEPLFGSHPLGRTARDAAAAVFGGAAEALRLAGDRRAGAAAPAGLSTPEPPPTPNAQPACWDLVMTDMRERDQWGQRKYGTRLQANNGRDVLRDLYQELLDAAVYIRQAIYERDGR